MPSTGRIMLLPEALARTCCLDPDIECECPRLVGIEWVPAPGRHVWNSEEAVLALKAEITGL